MDGESPPERARRELKLQDCGQHALKVGHLGAVLCGGIGELDTIKGMGPNRQDEFGFAIDAPALRLGQDGLQGCAGFEESNGAKDSVDT